MIEEVFPHVGEILLERIFNEDKSLLANFLEIEESNIQSVHRQLPLEFVGSPVIFDGFSTLDLGVLLKNNKVLPIEVKLGRFGLAKASVNKMLNPCSISAHTSEYRVSGKLFAILNRNYDSELAKIVGNTELCTRINGETHPISDVWGVIARDSVISSWKKMPPDFNGKQKIISIESVCSSYGEHEFNNLVGGIFSGVNFYNTWFPQNA